MNTSARRLSVALAAGTGVAAAIHLWPHMRRWGATCAEVSATMPGDELVGTARYSSTHAITIAAPVEEVWPWLAQLGQGRGGLYSHDWLENLLGLDIHSLDQVDPRLQELAVGDVIRLVPEGTQPPLRFRVTRLEAPGLLLLGPDQSKADAFAARLPYPFWTFQLRAAEEGACRLVVRFQMDFEPTVLNRLTYGRLLQPVHFVMEREMLLGLKRRAQSSARQAQHLAVWPVAFRAG